VQIIHIPVHNLFPCFPGPPLCLAPSISKIKHFVTQSPPSVLKTCPYHCNIWTTFTMSSISNRCLNSTQNSLRLHFTPHINLIILISVRCNASSFSLFNVHVLLLCNILMHQTFPQNNTETFLKVRKEATDLNLNQPLRILAVTASASPSTDIDSMSPSHGDPKVSEPKPAEPRASPKPG